MQLAKASGLAKHVCPKVPLKTSNDTGRISSPKGNCSPVCTSKAWKMRVPPLAR